MCVGESEVRGLLPINTVLVSCPEPKGQDPEWS